MKIKIGKDINWLVGIGIINLVMGMFCYFSTMHENLRMILFPVLVIFYLVVFVCQKNDEKKILFIIVSVWQFTLMLDIIYRLVRYEKTPFEVLNIFDILGLIFLFVLLVKRGIPAKGDVVQVWFLVFAMYGIVVTLVNGSNLIDCLTALKLLFRFWGIYLYLSNSEVRFPKWFSFIVPVSILTFVAEVFLNVNVDFRNGIFGYQYTSEMFPFVLIIGATPLLIAGYKKTKYLVGTFFAFCGVEICFALMEAKAEMVLFVIWLLMIFVITKAQDAWLKRGLIAIIVVAGLFVFWNIMLSVNTKFSNLDFSLFESLYYRMLSAEARSYSAIRIVEGAEVSSIWQRLFGVGMGAALPPQNLRWIIQSGVSIDDLSSIFKASEIYQKYPNLLAFFGFSYYTTKLDLGLVGVLAMAFLLVNLFYRSFVLCKYSGAKYDNVLGAVGVWQVIILVYRSYSASIIIVPISMVVTFALFGLISYRYKMIKRESIQGVGYE